MAGSEGSGPTDLLSGWSCVFHRPSEDPEPSELPSTVDMAAFSSGLNVDATQGTQHQDSCDSESDSDSDSNNSGSEVSGSCSPSDSSDSETSSSSAGSSSRSSSPEFSVTSSQTNGLRLKIATVRKSCASPVEKTHVKSKAAPQDSTKGLSSAVIPHSTLTSTSEGSACSQSSSDSSSDSDEDDDDEDVEKTHHPSTTISAKSVEITSDNSRKSAASAVRKQQVLVTKNTERNVQEKKIIRKETSSGSNGQKGAAKTKTRTTRRSRKMASLPLSRGSTGSSSDNESSDSDSKMLASLSLQEIRQEDLAAILPDQQECDAFGAFDCRPDKNSPQTGDGSGSDMELPQQAVNALLQRTTDSSSDSESPTPLNPHTLYANSLLQQFVAQTQMLNAPSSLPPTSTDLMGISAPTMQTTNDTQQNCSIDLNLAKRKRGRPKKPCSKSKKCSNSSSKCDDVGKLEPLKPLSLDFCGNPNVSPDSGIQNSSDHISSPEPSPCPPNVKHKSTNVVQEVEKKKEMLENSSKHLERDTRVSLNTRGSVNMKIAQNKQRLGKIKEQPKLPMTSNSFDRVLYGNADRVLYPPRRKAGRPPVTRKGPGRPTKIRSGSVQEIKPPDKPSEMIKKQLDVKSINSNKKRGQNDKTTTCDNGRNKNFGRNIKETATLVQKKSKSILLREICERVSERLDINNKHPTKRKIRTKNNLKTGVRAPLSAKTKTEIRYATFKNAKLMHSKHKHKKHKKCKFRILKPVNAFNVATVNQDQKLDQEIEKLVADFVKLCCISTQKSARENMPEIFKALKKSTKKRKISEYNERKKKKISVASSTDKETTPNEQRLPLKKRHYHLSANVHSENKSDPNGPSEGHEKKKDVQSKEGRHQISTATSKTNADKSKSSSSKNSTTTTNVSVKNEPNVEVAAPESSTAINGNLTETHEVTSECNKVGTHIDEAIEATITRYSHNNNNNNLTNTKLQLNKSHVSPVKEEKSNVPLTATTPKKRHWLEVKNNNIIESKISEDDIKTSDKVAKNKTSLENVVLELKLKKKLNETGTKKVAKDEIVAQIITRKKNRLEDLTSNLASKINTVTKEDENSTADTNQRKKKEHAGKNEEVVTARNTVIKSPVSKKIKAPDIDKLDSITAENPTGIFMPTVDLELHIPSTTIETNKENVALKKETFEEDTTTKIILNTIQITQSSEKDEVTKKKIRKRRAINRTGFPTVKKKKKKTFSITDTKVPKTVPAVEPQPLEVKTNVCDRVPREGEKYSAFVQRTEKIVVSDVLLEKLQKSAAENVKNIDEKPPPHLPNNTAEIQPLAFVNVKQERPSSRLSIKQEKRDKSVSSETSDSVISHASKRIKTDSMYESYGDLDDLSLEERLERSKAGRRPSRTTDSRKQQQDSSKFVIHRRRLRDISPSSSDESKKNKKAPRWRKRYLVAGLFSDYYKEDDEIVRQRRTEAANRPTKLTYKPEEHRYGLLPPPYHCGKFLRCRKLPFKLPYDLWWQHVHNQLPGRDIVPSWNYRKIRTNVYNVKSTTMGVCETQACNCSPMSGCGDDCINRLVYVECPGTHKCQNQKIQRHEWALGIEKFMTEDKGWGVRTNLAIKSGEFILEYVGEVVSDQEFKERMATRYAHDTHHYCLHLDGGLVIDGHRMGGEGRFVNHSCEPNCEMQKWSVNGQFRMALFALRDIRPGEELTYDYNFSLFNPADGQECKCGSEHCRGVIGGKSQRARQLNSSTAGRVGRPRKNRAKRSSSAPKETTSNALAPTSTNTVTSATSMVTNNQTLLPIVPLLPSVKPMTGAQRSYVREHHCFLPRNLTRVRRLRERSVSTTSVGRTQNSTPTGGVCTSSSGSVIDHRSSPSTFLNHLNAIRQPRNMKTRRLAQAEDDPELNKTAKLAAVLKDLCGVVSSVKDENNELLCTPFVNLPSRRKLAEYYTRIPEPIDLTTIEQNIATGIYKNVDSFDCDMMRLFNNAVKFFGRTSETGIAATRLKKSYQEAKQEHIAKLEEVLGEKVSNKFISRKNKNEEEDVIRCICGMYRDEGLMIQCERCLVWQHCECIKADPNAPSYHCERCTPRVVDFEIPLDEFTEHGHRFYMTLLRDDLQLRQGDTVYVLRDIPIPGTDKKHDYKTIGEIEYTELDIFRIERLWKDSQTGQRYAYGHHYLRPHETFHEPTRKFFSNEVMRVPLYEAVPVELIIGHCWVMDLNTYCKGRPLAAPEDHIYICEYRVDKSARLFSKISKTKFPICTKSYAFERFETRLKVSRTYTPHDLDPALVKPRGRKMQDQPESTTTTNSTKEVANQRATMAAVSVSPLVRTRTEQKARLNKILLNLLSKMPTKQILDVSYLLEGGRRRKKQT